MLYRSLSLYPTKSLMLSDGYKTRTYSVKTCTKKSSNKMNSVSIHKYMH